MKTVLLVIPRTFNVRAFLMTSFIEILSQYVKVAVVSPFDENPEFVRRFTRENVSFHKLPDFPGFQGRHRRWQNFYSSIVINKWNISAQEITRKLENYLTGNIKSSAFSLNNFIYIKITQMISGQRAITKIIRKAEISSFWKTYDMQEYENLFLRIKPDVIMSTKSAIWDEYPIARLGEKFQIPQMTYVLSFDNITTNGIFPVNYNKWLVWNDINKAEVLKQYPDVNKDDIVICGSLQFDFYYNLEKYLIDKVKFFEQLKLDISRPILLFGAGPRIIADQEPHVAEQIADAIREKEFFKRPQLLIRLHPDDTLERWESIRLKYPEVRFSLPWTIIEEKKHLAIPTNDDISLLVSTLVYSDAVINTSSSMALDAACFDKPIISLAYDDRPGKPFDGLCQQLYEREHYVPITNSGGIKLVFSKKELVTAINQYLEAPADDHEKRYKMLELYDPFKDGNAGLRSANAILDFLHIER